MDFQIFFKSGRTVADKRGKYLSKVFGTFSEEIVDIWCKNKNSKYENIGRPTIYTKNKKHYTLDFTFRDKSSMDNKNYIVEMKSEIQYQNYKFMVLGDTKPTAIKPKQTDFFKHHKKKPAFNLFLDYSNTTVKINNPKKKIEVAGSILVWGSIEKDFSLSTFNKNNNVELFDVLSVENMINDLIKWKDKNYQAFVNEYTNWSADLFSNMLKL